LCQERSSRVRKQSDSSGAILPGNELTARY
jgi:hypothetical protein